MKHFDTKIMAKISAATKIFYKIHIVYHKGKGNDLTICIFFLEMKHQSALKIFVIEYTCKLQQVGIIVL